MEVYTNQFLRNLTSNYTAGDTSLHVDSAAPAAVQTGTFRVRLANTQNTLLKVTAGAATTTWTVSAEANDANCAAASNAVLACEVTAGMLDGIRADDAPYYTRTDPTLVTFSWRNQGTATVTTRNRSMYLSAPAASGDQIRGQEIAAPSAPVSITAGIVLHIHDQNYNGAGIYVSDGTKLITCFLGNPGNNNQLAVAAFNNASSFSSLLANPKVGYYITPVFLKVFDNGTNLSWYWSPNGQDFVQIYSAGRTAFLSSISTIGWFADSNNSSWPAGILLVSWTQGTS